MQGRGALWVDSASRNSPLNKMVGYLKINMIIVFTNYESIYFLRLHNKMKIWLELQNNAEIPQNDVLRYMYAY